MHFNTLEQWLSWLEQLHPTEIDLGLERIRQVADRLAIQPGNAKVITVAGTNGKGSTLAFLEAILLAAGYRVARYTSPHLYRFNERICINGKAVDDEVICDALASVEAQRQNVSLTYFEFTTLAALQIFQQAEVDIWLLEVGLGGRLDAVNIIDPDCAVITSIGLDHMDWLGDTREAIGFEKAGILRAGIPAVFGGEDMPDSIQAQADRLGAMLLCSGRDFQAEAEVNGWSLSFTNGVWQHLPSPGLEGAYQLRNAASAILALRQLPSLSIDRAAVEQGLKNAQLNGRFQRVPGEIEIIFDVAHNPDGVQVLARQLDSTPVTGKTWAVFTALRDKDIPGMVQPLLPKVAGWFVTGNSAARGQSAADIAAKCEGWSPALYNDAPSAWQAARKAACAGDRIIVYGSFYLVGELLREVEHG